jgi:DNA-binding HxlR family transcriptional regulator
MIPPVTTPLDLDPRITGRDGPRPECSIARTLDVLSTRSSFLLLREAFYGATRFEEFASRVGISDPVASARLKELVAAGLLAREPYREPGQRTRSAYALTEKGAELLPVLTSLLNWGDRWREEGSVGPVTLTHVGCGEPVEVQLRCAAGHEVHAGEIHVAPRRPPIQAA